jgi:hypothetical protein
VATRIIEKGEEVLISYGSSYWICSSFPVSVLRQAKLNYHIPSDIVSGLEWDRVIQESAIREINENAARAIQLYVDEVNRCASVARQQLLLDSLQELRTSLSVHDPFTAVMDADFAGLSSSLELPAHVPSYGLVYTSAFLDDDMSSVPSVPADATIVCLSHAALDSSGSDGGSTVSENGESTCSKDF